MVILSMCFLTFSTVPLGETVNILVNISEHKHADEFVLTGNNYYDRIKKIGTTDWNESCYQEEWLEICEKWIKLTYVGNGTIRVEITAKNKTMARVYKLFARCTGVMNVCSSLPLVTFTIVIQDKGRLRISIYF